jgi:hypothetical protein
VAWLAAPRMDLGTPSNVDRVHAEERVDTWRLGSHNDSSGRGSMGRHRDGPHAGALGIPMVEGSTAMGPGPRRTAEGRNRRTKGAPRLGGHSVVDAAHPPGEDFLALARSCASPVRSPAGRTCVLARWPCQVEPEPPCFGRLGESRAGRHRFEWCIRGGAGLTSVRPQHRGPARSATLYRAASVYVFPTSQADAVIGIPMSVMEAHANGTPVVAMRSDSMRRWTGMTDVHIADGDAEFLSLACQVADSPTISARSRGLWAESCNGDFLDCESIERAS